MKLSELKPTLLSELCCYIKLIKHLVTNQIQELNSTVV